jgi:hypothetical protein
MVNTTAPVYIKPTVAFNRGDTFSSAPGSALLTVLDLSNAASPCRADFEMRLR